MRVLLAFAPYRHDMIYPDSMGRKTIFAKKRYGRIGGVTPPLGILTLAAVLLRSGHDVKVLMGFFETEDSFLLKTKEYNPHVVGFHTTYFSWPLVRDFVPKVKALLPNVRTMIGGPYASFIGNEPMEKLESLDVSVQGEAEETIGRICEALPVGGDLSAIPGLIWRNGKEIISNSEPVFPDDLDETPYPAYQLVDIREFVPSIGSYNRLPSVNIMTSRGCDKKCTFCIARDHIRYRSIEHTMGEIRHAVRGFGARHLLFFDEYFTADNDRAINISERIMEEGFKFSFAINARTDPVSLELFKVLRKAGCWRVLFGIESGTQKNLDSIQKDQTLDQCRRAVTLAKEAKLHVRTMFMFGIPGETFEEGLETINFAISLNPDIASFSNFTPLPGAPIWEEIHDLGTLTNTGGLHLVNFVPNTMTRDQLIELNRIAFKRFYLRPFFLLRRAFSIRSITDILRYARGFLAFSRLKGPGRHRLSPHDLDRNVPQGSTNQTPVSTEKKPFQP